MFRPSSLSNWESVAANQNSLNYGTSPSQPHYERQANGLLKYIVNVDLRGVPRENLRVSARQYVVLIEAKYEHVSHYGERTTHEVLREIHVPLTVDLRTVRCVYSDSGILTIEADAEEPLTSRPPQIPNRFQPKTKVTSPLTNLHADARKVTFMEPPRSNAHGNMKTAHYASPLRHPIPSPLHRPEQSAKRLSIQGPERYRNATYLQQVPDNPSPSITSPGNHTRIHHPIYHSAHPTSPRNFNLRVEIGSDVKPNELSITRQDGVILVHAKRYTKNKNVGKQRLVFEHRSEHTIPNNVDVDHLNARLENGTVYIDAPYFQHARSPPPVLTSPKLVNRVPNLSERTTNNQPSRPR